MPVVVSKEEIDTLRSENARLVEDNEHLFAENERMRAALNLANRRLDSETLRNRVKVAGGPALSWMHLPDLQDFDMQYILDRLGEQDEYGSGIAFSAHTIKVLIAEILNGRAAVQRESTALNEAQGVIAFLSGVLTEIRDCLERDLKSDGMTAVIGELVGKSNAARTYIEMALTTLIEWHTGTWKPGQDDPASWRQSEVTP